MLTKHQVYVSSMVISAVVFVLATAAGFYESIKRTHRPPGLRQNYGPEIDDMIKAGDYQNARKELLMAARIDSINGLAQLKYLSGLAMREKDRQTQIDALRQLVKSRRVQDPKIYNDLSSALLEEYKKTRRRNVLLESVEVAEMAIKRNPNFAPAHCNLGAGWLLLGNPQKAAAHFQEAISLDPSIQQARDGLKYIRDNYLEKQPVP